MISHSSLYVQKQRTIMLKFILSFKKKERFKMGWGMSIAYLQIAFFSQSKFYLFSLYILLRVLMFKITCISCEVMTMQL